MSWRARTILVTLLFLVAGCVYTPLKSPEVRSSLIGTGSHYPTQIGKTSRDAVIARFGLPTYSSRHYRACGYLFATDTGRATGLLPGPCTLYFGCTVVSEMDDIWLEFDADGILRRCEKRLLSKYDDEKAWREFLKTVPDPIRQDQMLDGLP
jgi:hypothetical protein